MSKTVKEAMCNIDAEEIEIEYAKRKTKHNWDQMDVRARNAFSNKLVTSSIIKCASGLDYYGLRNEIINKTNNKCSRYDCVEMCDYAVCSEKTKDFRKQLVADLLKDLIAARTDEVIHNDFI